MLDQILIISAVSIRILSNPVANVFQKQLTTKGTDPLTINFLTYFFLSVVCIIPVLSIQLQELSFQFWLFSVLGGIAGASGNGFLIKALQRGELSVLGPINAYKSVIGLVGGIILLREIPGIQGLSGIVLIILGSYFVLDTTKERFSFALFRNREIQFRIYAMILTAIEAVLIKKVIVESSVVGAFISWCFFGALFSFILFQFSGKKMSEEIRNFQKDDFSKIIFLILCIGAMQFTTNYAIDNMPVGYALSLFQLSAVVSVILGNRFFSELDTGRKLAGSAIMITGSVVIILLTKS